MKHFATSSGIGAAAGMARRYRKSPVGFVRLKTIVLSFGVSMPEIGFGGPGSVLSRPSITPV